MNSIVVNSVRFIVVVLLQVLIFNNINLFGNINPMPYVVWLLLFPVKKDKLPYLFGAFALGISIDFFSNSGGINAAASLLIAYLRLSVLQFVLRKKDIDFSLFTISIMPFSNLLYYMFIMVFIHHLVVFNLEYFDFSKWKLIFTQSIVTSIFTVFLCIASVILFIKKK